MGATRLIALNLGKTRDLGHCTQTLSLMLAVYLRQTIVFLLGYDISNPTELTRLKSIMRANPNTKFMYLCNPPRTYQLDDLDNGFCDTFVKFQELIDRAE